VLQVAADNSSAAAMQQQAYCTLFVISDEQ
jgi:hypothetical protein